MTQINDLLSIPLKLGSGASVYIRDVGSVSDTSDVLAGYALLNGKRTIYIPVTKRPDASTLTVVQEVRENLARFQSLVPEDIKITYEFDQSAYVRNALMSVLREAIIGAVLTGLTLLLFLRDWRSSLIVVITIPFALLTAVVLLKLTGQTINIMTLGGWHLPWACWWMKAQSSSKTSMFTWITERTQRGPFSLRVVRSQSLDCLPCSA